MTGRQGRATPSPCSCLGGLPPLRAVRVVGCDPRELLLEPVDLCSDGRVRLRRSWFRLRRARRPSAEVVVLLLLPVLLVLLVPPLPVLSLY